MSKPEVILASATRTAIGTYDGTLKGTPATELGAVAIRAALERSGLSGADIGTVAMGNVIQAGNKKLSIASVPVGTNPKTRESRLVKSIPRFIMLQLSTMIRMYAMFKPLKAFFVIGVVCILFGLIPSGRFLFFYLAGKGDGHIQSLIMAAVLFIIGFQVLVLGLLGDVISHNRKLIEETLLRVRRMELEDRNDLEE